MAIEPSSSGASSIPPQVRRSSRSNSMNLASPAPGGSATGSIVGLGFSQAASRRTSIDEQDDGDRDSTGTSPDGSETAENWGEIDAFSPVATRTYRLHAPPASLRDTSPTGMGVSTGSKQPRSQPVRNTVNYPAASVPLSTTSSTSSFLNASSSHSYGGYQSPQSSTLSPVASTSGTSRRNSETWLAIAPSPPAISAPFSTGLSRPASSQGGLHNRNVSLTSACLPISSSSPSKERRNRRSSGASLSPNQAGRQTSGPESPWRPFPWSKRHDQRAPPAKTSRLISHSSQSPLWKGTLRTALGPLAPHLLPEPPQIPTGAGTKRTLEKASLAKRPETTVLPRKVVAFLRLAAITYICFSLLFLASHLVGLAFDHKPGRISLPGAGRSLRPRESLDEYTRWQRAKLRIVGVYNVAADALHVARLGPQQTSKEAAGDFASESVTQDVQQNQELLQKLPEIRRKWGGASSRETASSPLSPFSHKYRFSKLSSKMDFSQHDQLEPFLFRAQNASEANSITACLYYNDAWIGYLPDFVERWQGPISVVYEILEPRNSSARDALIERLGSLISENPSVQAYVDFHAVYTPQSSEFQHSRSRERLLTRPVGTNFQLNLARLFARTELVWLVSDARVLPSTQLHTKLARSDVVKTLLLDQADAIVVPLFGAFRQNAYGSSMPNLTTIRRELGYSSEAGDVDGVSADEFRLLGAAYTAAHKDSLPIPMDQWPTRKSALVGLASTHPPASVLSEHMTETEHAIFALHDRHWDAGKGPTGFQTWRKARSTASEEEDTEIDDSIVTEDGFYQVTDYDLHYNPSLLIGRDRQPWCTERFEYNRAVCSYQMYLQGAKMWVMPDEWAFTLESIDKGEKIKKNEAEKLKSAISTRLYTKFHSEACMHYGRAFLSMDLWDSERAQHLRYSCSHVFSSYGIGNAEEKPKPVVVVEPEMLEQK